MWLSIRALEGPDNGLVVRKDHKVSPLDLRAKVTYGLLDGQQLSPIYCPLLFIFFDVFGPKAQWSPATTAEFL